MLKDKKLPIVWIARLLVGIVTFLNLQAAFYFLIRPQDYAPGFELIGEPGSAMIRGVGLLFVMWNIPYIVALIHPMRHFVSLIEAVVMQAIGVVGESLILLTIPDIHLQIHSSVMRFIFFDGAGLISLVIALILMVYAKKKK